MPTLVRVDVDRISGWTALRFPYVARLANAVKDIPGAAWDPGAKLWRVPCDALPLVRQIPGAVLSIENEYRREVAIPPEYLSMLKPFQREGVERLVTHGGYLLAFQQRLGKAVDVETPVLTPTGWRRIGNLQPGDRICDPDGGVAEVTAVFPQGTRPAFRLATNDGATVVCDAEHLWLVQTPWDRYTGRDRVVSTRDMIGNLRNEFPHAKGGRKFRLPVSMPVEFRVDLPLPLDPWLLGALLADGYFNPKYLGITKGHPEFIEKVRAVLPPDVGMKQRGNRPADWRFIDAEPIRAALDDLGLLGKHSEEKFIPIAYLLAPVEARLALLRGLMDGDGDCSMKSNGYKGCVASFNTTSPQLRDGMLELIGSLGGFASVYEYPEPTYTTSEGEKKVGLPSWRLHIRMPVNPFSMPWKAERWSLGYLARSVESIESVGERDMVCIATTSKRELFITKGYIVTHNTPTAITAARVLWEARIANAIVVVYPAGVQTEWERQLPQWWPAARLLPFRAKGGRDGAFYAYLRQRLDGARTWPFILGIHYEILHLPDVIGEVLNLLSGARVITIADEIQNAKNRASPRTKNLWTLGERSIARWGLSGTPMRNRNRDLYAIFEFLTRYSCGLGYWKWAIRYAGAVEEEYGWTDRGGHDSNADELKVRLAEISLRRTRVEVADQLPKADRHVFLCDMPKKLADRYAAMEEQYARDLSSALDDDASPAARAALEHLVGVTSQAKIPAVLDRIQHYTEGGFKVVVFSHFHDTLGKLADAYVAQQPEPEPGTGGGGEPTELVIAPDFLAGGWMTPAQRKSEIDGWKAAPGGAVLFANTLACSTGIDLSDAEAAIYCELEWVPTDMAQSESRIVDVHLGKRKTPPVYEYACARGTVDEAMAAALLVKLRNMDAVGMGEAEANAMGQALREAGVAGERECLPSTDKETVQAAIRSMRDRWLSDEQDVGRTIAAAVAADWEDDTAAQQSDL